MPEYLEHFTVDQRNRVLRFLVLFARCEAVLKLHWGCTGNFGQAEVRWDAFVNTVAPQLDAATDKEFLRAREYLQQYPPKRQVIQHGQLDWRENPKRAGESDSAYLLRIVRDVRNNLFHGGKYASGVLAETARDDRCVDSATVVLEYIVGLDRRTHAALRAPE